VAAIAFAAADYGHGSRTGVGAGTELLVARPGLLVGPSEASEDHLDAVGRDGSAEPFDGACAEDALAVGRTALSRGLRRPWVGTYSEQREG
jgi:hypothetical protein